MAMCGQLAIALVQLEEHVLASERSVGKQSSKNSFTVLGTNDYSPLGLIFLFVVLCDVF